MANVNATKYGKVGSTLVSSWTTARETGNFANNQETGANVTTLLAQRTSRNGINYRVTRSFLAFDLSAYEGQTIIDLTLTFRQTSSTVAGGMVISILKSTAQGSGSTFSDLTTSDFFTTIDFSTVYANWIPFMSSINSNNVQALNAAAMVDASSGSLRLALVQTQNDKNNLQPSSDQTKNGNWNLDTSGDGFIPFLTFTAVDWGEKVNSVPVATIEKVNGVPRSTIDSINIYDLPSNGGQVYVFKTYGIPNPPNNTSIATYTNVIPGNLALGDTLYLNPGLTTVAANISADLAGIDAWSNGSPYCSANSTLITTNSSGVITAFTCLTNDQ